MSARGPRRSLLIGAALVILAAVLSLGGCFWNRSLAARPASGPIRLVVLPFENLGALSTEYFADGLTEEITTRLARIAGLAVIAPSTAAGL